MNHKNPLASIIMLFYLLFCFPFNFPGMFISYYLLLYMIIPGKIVMLWSSLLCCFALLFYFLVSFKLDESMIVFSAKRIDDSFF